MILVVFLGGSVYDRKIKVKQAGESEKKHKKKQISLRSTRYEIFTSTCKDMFCSCLHDCCWLYTHKRDHFWSFVSETVIFATQAASQRLANTHDVGHHLGMLRCKELPCTTKARSDPADCQELTEHEGYIVTYRVYIERYNITHTHIYIYHNTYVQYSYGCIHIVNKYTTNDDCS